MGCGSSKSAVAVINNASPVNSSVNVENFVAKSSSIENKQSWNINVSSSSNDCQNTMNIPDNSIIKVKNAFMEDDLLVNSSDPGISPECTDLGSRNSIKNSAFESKTKINYSDPSMSNMNLRDKSASSTGSRDSGVFDEAERNNSGRSLRSIPGRIISGRSQQSNSGRINSGISQCSMSDSLSGKPPSGKKSSARKRLLRIDDDLDNDSELIINEQSSDPLETYSGQNMTLRPKSRYGNLAFDIVLDTPETGNTKKKPEKLAALSIKKTKKVKTKKDIEKKMEEVAARRKIQEGEKLLKAKQFQHFSVCTPVEVFHPDEDEEEEERTPVHPLYSNSSVGNKSLTDIHDKDYAFDGNKTLIESFHYSGNEEEEEKETIVEPFHLESDDDDSLNDNRFLGRMNFQAQVRVL